MLAFLFLFNYAAKRSRPTLFPVSFAVGFIKSWWCIVFITHWGGSITGRGLSRRLSANFLLYATDFERRTTNSFRISFLFTRDWFPNNNYRCVYNRWCTLFTMRCSLFIYKLVDSCCCELAGERNDPAALTGLCCATVRIPVEAEDGRERREMLAAADFGLC